VLVLHGEVGPGAPAEEQDTRVQAEAVRAALERRGHSVRTAGITLDLKGLRSLLAAPRPGLVFNLVESLEGSDRFIAWAPALLEELRLPFTGASSEALTLTSNKLVCKRLLTLHGIRTPAWSEPGRGAGAPGAGPWIVKSVWAHASLGMDDSAWIGEREGLEDALAARRERFGGEWFAESYVEGREFNISLLGTERGPLVLPLAEMEFEGFPPGKPRIVGYLAKWDPQSYEYRHTVRRFLGGAEPELAKSLTRISLKCWSVFRLEGYARVDFRVDEQGQPWVLEINANPGLAPDAGFPAAAAEAGIGYDDLIARIAEDGLRRGTSGGQRPH
jgi:D-alanine-D-alanine ligase